MSPGSVTSSTSCILDTSGPLQVTQRTSPQQYPAPAIPDTSAAVAITLIVAGCSLAVAIGGGLVDRKRPFTLLRVSGTPVGTLARVVMLEAAVPLVAATVAAAAIAYGTSLLAFIRLAPAGTAIPQFGADYYALMGIGLAIAFAVITVTLPLLRRMTAPAGIRFE